MHSTVSAVAQAGAAYQHVPARTTQAARHLIAPAASPKPAPGPGSPPRASADEEFTAALLIPMRPLASGRTLHSDIRSEQISIEELIRSRADDLTVSSGCHAGPAASLTGAAR